MPFNDPHVLPPRDSWCEIGKMLLAMVRRDSDAADQHLANANTRLADALHRGQNKHQPDGPYRCGLPDCLCSTVEANSC